MQTTAYHPEGNGLVEGFHCRLMDALHACCTGSSWADNLPWVMLGLQHVKTQLSHPLRPFSVQLCVSLANCLKNLNWLLMIS